mmetsp:Transcript_31744/g.62385  ORF Transcript_31744/g.62385 Transcript_31744/m.62385 type:complete len:229 (-) Transcript_31744:41-727(-)
MRVLFLRARLPRMAYVAGRRRLADAAGPPGPKDSPYIQHQLELLRKFEEREAAKRDGQDGDDLLGKVLPWIIASAFASLFGGIGYMIWENQRREAKMKAFLAEKEAEEGVIRTSSGLLYRVLRTGSGRHHPTARSSCYCNYRGTLIDGTEFDSSYGSDKPAIFSPHQLIKGWSEALQLMVEGDEWEVYVPAQLGYKNESTGKIPAGSALIFQVELVRIEGNRVEKTKL